MLEFRKSKAFFFFLNEDIFLEHACFSISLTEKKGIQVSQETFFTQDFKVISSELLSKI